MPNGADSRDGRGGGYGDGRGGGRDRWRHGAYAAAHFGLELDGNQDISLFRTIEGGGVKADVMTYQNGTNYDRWRILGKPKFEDIKMMVGMSMSKPFYSWIEHFFEGKADRRNGAILAADFYYTERARRTFKEAMIKELTFPKFDAQDKHPCYMGVTIAVEEIEYAKGSGNKLPIQASGFDNKQKHWTANNFELVIDDSKFEQAAKRVTKIDSFSIKQNILEYHSGGFKAPTKTPSSIDFPSISFHLPEPDALPFMEHMTKRIGWGSGGRGEVRDASTINGHLEALDNELKPIFRLQFYGADFVAVHPDRHDATAEELKLVKVEMFTEKMKFEYLQTQSETTTT